MRPAKRSSPAPILSSSSRARIRSMARLYCSEEEDKGWFHDRQHPFLLDMGGYDIRVKELSAEEREANLETLKFIGREATCRGLDFQLALWTQRYDFDDVPRANYAVEGVTDANLTLYC